MCLCVVAEQDIFGDVSDSDNDDDDDDLGGSNGDIMREGTVTVFNVNFTLTYVHSDVVPNLKCVKLIREALWFLI